MSSVKVLYPIRVFFLQLVFFSRKPYFSGLWAKFLLRFFFCTLVFTFFSRRARPSNHPHYFWWLEKFFWKFWVCLCKTMERKSVRAVHWSFRSFVGRGLKVGIGLQECHFKKFFIKVQVILEMWKSFFFSLLVTRSCYCFCLFFFHIINIFNFFTFFGNIKYLLHFKNYVSPFWVELKVSLVVPKSR